jgi:hypothetical protein
MPLVSLIRALDDVCVICRDASPTSKISVEIQVKSGPLQWGKKEQGSKEIDCQALFKDYWDTTAHEFSVRGQSESPISPLIVDRKGAADIVAGKHSCSLELQFSAEVYRSSSRNCPPQAADSVRIDGFATLLAA